MKFLTTYIDAISHHCVVLKLLVILFHISDILILFLKFSL